MSKSWALSDLFEVDFPIHGTCGRWSDGDACQPFRLFDGGDFCLFVVHLDFQYLEACGANDAHFVGVIGDDVARAV